ncbi:MAG: alpha/beta fold hydrolase [Phycisphaeraceae bacterium]
MIGLLILLATGLLVLWVGTTLYVFWRLRHPPRWRRAMAITQGIPVELGDYGLHGDGVVFRFARGTETPGWIIKGGRPDRPAVVITHGFGDSRFGSMMFSMVYAPHASAVVVYDLAAHGDSTDHKLGFALRETDDLAEIIAQLPDEVKQRGLVLAGYSMGGTVSVRASLLPSVRGWVRGLVLDGPYCLWWQPMYGMLQVMGYPANSIVFLARVLRPLLCPGVTEIDNARDVARLDVPVLVMHGDDDGVCPVEAGRELAEAAKYGRLEVFEGGGHLDLAAVNPERYHAVLESFFMSFDEESAVAVRVAD